MVKKIDYSNIMGISDVSPIYICIVLFLFIAIYMMSKKLLESGVISYSVLIIFITIISRKPSENTTFVLLPFWSYLTLIQGLDNRLFSEIILNIAMFVPLGVMLTLRFQKKGILIGLLFSIIIEFLQFALHRGVAEIDDVINNTFGVIIGWGILRLINILLYRKREKQ